MADVFISYKRDERPLIERIAAVLESLACTVWFDASLESGESFNQEIDREARGARVILVCWSPGAVASDWVQAESLIGFNARKLAACVVGGNGLIDPPTPFNAIQAQDLRNWDGSLQHPGFQAVVRRIADLVGRPGLAAYLRLPDPSARTRRSALEQWAGSFAADPLSAQVWAEIEALTLDETKQQIAAKQADAARRAAEQARPQAASATADTGAHSGALNQGFGQSQGGHDAQDQPKTSGKAGLKAWQMGGLALVLGAFGYAVLPQLTGRSGSSEPPAQDSGQPSGQNANAAPADGGEPSAKAAPAPVPVGPPIAAPGPDVSLGLSEEANAFDAARKQNTVASWTSFLKAYPAGANALAAKKALALAQSKDGNFLRAEFNRAAEAGPDALRVYLRTYPDSPYADTAKALLDQPPKTPSAGSEAADWARAKAQNTLKAYQAFLKAHPNSQYEKEAVVAIEGLGGVVTGNPPVPSMVQTAASPVWRQPGGQCTDTDVVIYFQPDRATLSPAAQEMVDRLAGEILKCEKTYNLTVTGKAGQAPGAYAQKLAERLAGAVSEALAVRGVDQSKIQRIGTSSFARASNPAENTRVEIELDR